MGPPSRSFAADAHDCIMVWIRMGPPNTRVWRDVPPLMASSPPIITQRPWHAAAQSARTAGGYVDDRRRRPALLPPLPEQARKAGKCLPSPTYPPAPPTRRIDNR